MCSLRVSFFYSYSLWLKLKRNRHFPFTYLLDIAKVNFSVIILNSGFRIPNSGFRLLGLPREGALLTTLKSEASLMGTQCPFCASEATSRCLDCGPSMSLCESCAVEKHRTVHIFHNVEILKVRNFIYQVSTCSSSPSQISSSNFL